MKQKKVTLTNCQGAPIQTLGFLVWSLYRLCINKLKRRSSGHALSLSMIQILVTLWYAS